MWVVYSNERRAGWLRGSDRKKKKKKKRTTMTMKNKGRQLALSIKVATMREREDERATAGLITCMPRARQDASTGKRCRAARVTCSYRWCGRSRRRPSALLHRWLVERRQAGTPSLLPRRADWSGRLARSLRLARSFPSRSRSFSFPVVPSRYALRLFASLTTPPPGLRHQ